MRVYEWKEWKYGRFQEYFLFIDLNGNRITGIIKFSGSTNINVKDGHYHCEYKVSNHDTYYLDGIHINEKQR
jgi:hypothetical protein